MTKRNNKSNWSHGVTAPEPDLPPQLKTRRECLHPRQVIEVRFDGLFQKCLRCGHTVEVEK